MHCTWCLNNVGRCYDRCYENNKQTGGCSYQYGVRIVDAVSTASLTEVRGFQSGYSRNIRFLFLFVFVFFRRGERQSASEDKADAKIGEMRECMLNPIDAR